jgi:lon-related putative ATP-dependent protease
MTVRDHALLPPEKLRKTTNPAALGFTLTSHIDCLEGLIGQKRAVKSIAFGLAVPAKGYNIFVVGNPGSGRTTYTLKQLQCRAEQETAPEDWVYVYNFADPGRPLAVNLPAGKGKELASRIEDLVEDLKVTLNKAFENNQYEDNKATLVKEFQEQVNAFMEELRAWASEKGFAIKRTPQGFVNIPLVNEQTEDGNVTQREMQQEEFEALSEERQKELQGNSEQISQRTLETLRKIRDLEKALKERIKDLEAEICRNAIKPFLQDLGDAFGHEGKIGEWIDELAEDIIANFSMFIAAARDENAEVDFSRYTVNVFVSNDPEKGAPVVFETNPTYYNMAGKVEYESRQGYLYTDFRRIVAGAMHKANGGYLLLEADDLFRHFMSWDAIKRVLKTGELVIENLGEQLGFVPVSSLRPEPIPLHIKIVIVGTRWIYHLLTIYDPEFPKLFKVKADFDVDMIRSEETERDMARFVAGFVKKENLLPFTNCAVAELTEWASRLAGHQERLSTQFNRIAETIVEASAWTQMDGKSIVQREDVRKALEEKTFRSNLIEERIQKAFEDGTIRIDTEGEVVGQVNGLTVIDMRDHAFGQPVRITANVFMGQEGVVNIEREVKMTGPIHNKGLLTLISYLGRTYAQDIPLALSARIAFEQTYDGIEGDSASSTELYCLLSALSGVPIRQGIAVTGSVDQFGNIQPIGGANEKIEGFYRYCKARRLTGDQGVLIPAQNVQNLMLHHELVEAVKNGEFSIWAISNIEEGIEILTGVPAGEPGSDGEYPEECIHGKVKKRLKEWLKRASALKKELGETNGGTPAKTNTHHEEDAGGATDQEYDDDNKDNIE